VPREPTLRDAVGRTRADTRRVRRARSRSPRLSSTMLSDVHVRIAGATAGKATTSLMIDSNNVINEDT
jgi:hypothetical protein